jgi:hypothetical protein
MMTTFPTVPRAEFVHYWRNHGTFRWVDLLPHAIWVGVLGVFALSYGLADPDRKFIWPALVLATSWVVLFPVLGIRYVHRKYDRFIRCPQCRDWFGQDVSGAYHGPNLKYREVVRTGCCHTCGTKILSEDTEGVPIT